MIFIPNPDEVVHTTLKPGDLIRIHRKGSVLIARQIPDGHPHSGEFTPMIFDNEQYSIEFHSGGHEIDHAYAHFIARAIASIAGLYVEDSYTIYEEPPTKVKFHQFPVTENAPFYSGADDHRTQR